MRTLRSLAIAAALGVSMTSAAHAIPTPYTSPAGGTCGGTSFRTCASLSITWTGTTATIQIQNLGTVGETFTSFGFTHMPAGASITGSTVPAALASRFTAGTANDIQALGFEANNPSPQTGLKAGEGPFTFTITFGGTFTGSAAQLAALDFSIHGQTGPNGCSTKLIIDPSGTVNNGPFDPNCSVGTTVIPEPITMTLLASGLAGMGGVGALRRRRKV